MPYQSKLAVWLSSWFHDDIPYFPYSFYLFPGWHTGGKSVFLTDAIADPADFMIAAFIGNILVIGNEAGSVEDDMIVDMVFINVGTDHIFIFSLQHLICKLLAQTMCSFW